MDTPKPMEGTWVLVAPNGREYTGLSPIQALRAEQAERVPAKVAVQRIMAEVALMNEGTALAEACGAYIAKLRAYVPQNMSGPEGGEAEAFKPGATLDQRRVSIGATDLQRGFMAVIRGIAQPTTF